MTLLIVEDDRGTALLVSRKAEEAGFETHCEHSGAAAVEWLAERAPLMAMFDYTLPDMNAEKLLAVLEERGIPIPPFIVATGRGDEQIAVDMMKRGARDYIVKDGTFLDLVPAVLGRVRRDIQNEIDRRQAEESRLLLERRVRQAQKLESLGVLAGGIAHDFNNLLMVILGNAELALSVLAPDSPARVNIQAVETATHRAASLVKQMLAYAGQGLLSVEPLDAAALVADVRPLPGGQAAGRVRFAVDTEPGLPAFPADAAQVRQVLTNLVANAVEAVGDSDGAVVVSAGRMECDRAYLAGCRTLDSAADGPVPGEYVYFEVADNACGMDEATQERIFEPFFSTKFTGRGLGMSAVLGIVRAHRAAIRIDSAPGAGTTVRVCFPVNPPAAADTQPV